MGKKPTFCCDCIHWEKVMPIAGDDFGICHDPTVPTKLRLDEETKIGEDGTVWSHEYFGCIYWRDRPNVLIDLNEEVPELPKL